MPAPRIAERRPTQAPQDLSTLPLPDEYRRLLRKQPFVVCAFYTPNYLPQILALKHSLEKHDLNHFLKLYPSQPTWEATTRLKAPFLLDCMTHFPNTNILYLDADAVVKKPPTHLNDITTDIALCVFNKPIKGKHCLQLSGGTVYIRNTEGARRFVSAWAAASKTCKSTATDEDAIHMAFSNLDTITISVLPPAFYKVFDNARMPDPIIEHFQASRSQIKHSKRLRSLKRYSIIAVSFLAALGAAYFIIHM